MSEDTKVVARRCLEDAEYAERVLGGTDFPEVRAAIRADLDEATEVEGFRGVITLGETKGIILQDLGTEGWASLPKTNLGQLAGLGGA